MPIFGVTASSNMSTKLTDFYQIATTTVGAGGATDITFSSIPANYTHLQIRGVARNTTGTTTVRLQFNTDTAANYSYHEFYADGTSAGAAAVVNASFIYIGAQIATANCFSPQIIDILDYTNTNKFKSIKNLNGYENNSAGAVAINSGNWRSTSAITSIKIYPAANSFAQYSTFALYGIKE
jgi:hypothetical protein